MTYRVSETPAGGVGISTSLSGIALSSPWSRRPSDASEAGIGGLPLLQTLAASLRGTAADSAAQAWISAARERTHSPENGFSALSRSDQGAIRGALGEAALNEFLSLSGEHDPNFRAEAILQFGARHERSRPALAFGLYSLVEHSTAEAALLSQARSRIAVLRGGGSLGQQFEFTGGQLAEQILDPSLLAGMTVAGWTFQSVRLAGLTHFAARSGVPLWRVGAGARALAWGGAFALEFPAFTLSVRGLREALGHPQDWSGDAVSRDLLLSGISLLALKGAGLGTQSALRRWRISDSSPAWTARLTRTLLPQAGMFTGILGAHALEGAAGLRPPSDGRSAVVQSLATLLHFNVSAHLLRGMPLAGFDRMAAEGEIRGRSLTQSFSDLWNVPGGFGLRSLAPAGASGLRIFRPAAEVPPGGQLMQMSAHGAEPPVGTNGNGSNGSSGGNGHRSVSEIKDLLDQAEASINPMTMSSIRRRLWGGIIAETHPEVLSGLESVRHRVSEDPLRKGDLPFLDDIQVELHRIRDIIRWDGQPPIEGTRYFPSAETWEVQRFLTFYYKGVNTLVNYLDGTAPANEPLNNFRYGLSWLRQALNIRDPAEGTPSIRPGDFPYIRTDNGSFRLPDGRLSIVVLGDEMGARTRELATQGHRVILIDPSLRVLQFAQLRTQRWETETRAKGDLTHDVLTHFVQGDWRETRADGDLVEAYYPSQLAMLPARSTPEARRAELINFLEGGLLTKLVTRGSGFILSDQHDAVADLGELIRTHSRLQLLEMVHGTTRLPLRGGRAVTAEEGEELISWLVFRRKAGDTVPPPFLTDQATP